jgi:hypothetical protein
MIRPVPSSNQVGSDSLLPPPAPLISWLGRRCHPSSLIMWALALGVRSFLIRASTAKSLRTCCMAWPLSPATTLSSSSMSSNGGAEGDTSPPVSAEDGLAYPESDPDESESSVLVGG